MNPVASHRCPHPGVRVAVAATFLAIVSGSGAVYAEPPRFLAEVDSDQVTAGEPFVYQVTLGIGNEQATDYRAPDFKGFRVLSASAAPNQSTQMQFGNGGMFVQVNYTWRYELSAMQKGRFAIGPARVHVNGQEFRSSVVTVSVSSPGAPAGPPPTAGAPPPATSGAPGIPGVSQGVPGGGVGLPPEATEGGSFIRVAPDKQKAFVGEAISVAWYLFMNQPADKYDTQVEPKMEGFWTEDVSVPARRGGMALTQEMLNGHSYQVGTVLKKALFPLQPGHLTITPMEAQIARVDFFGGVAQGQHLRSTPTTIDVLPLPKAGQPPGFDAANVGTLTLAARVDRSQVAVGEAVTLTIEVGGRGNLRKIALPNLPKLDGWKSYEPRVNVVVDPTSGVTGTKTAEILLLPERAGAVTLPALILDTFDPDTRRYSRLQTPPIALSASGDSATATRGSGGAGAAPPPGAFHENVIAGEIRPIHANMGLRRDIGTTFFRTRAFVGILALPPVAFMLAMAAFGFRDRLAEDTGARRRRRARKKVRAHLDAADGHRRRGEVGAFHIEIDRVIREALSARLRCHVKGLRMEELRALLAARGLPPVESDRVIDLLEECDRARFAPGSGGGDAASLVATLERASDLIELVEKAPLREEGGP